MPPKSCSVEERIQLYSVDGDNYTPVPGIIHDMTITNIVETGETDYTRKIKLFHEPITYTGTLKLPHKKMSKKTFKKWCMSSGLTRNQAEFLCRMMKAYKGSISYQEIYIYNMFIPSCEEKFGYILYSILQIGGIQKWMK